MPASASSVASLQSKIWQGSLALEIRLARSDCRTYNESEPYLIQCPRLSYLAFLLPRLHAFFSPSLIDPDVSLQHAWLSFEEVPLKWHYPLGLLYDLFSGAEPADIEPSSAIASVLASRGVVETGRGDLPIPWKLTIHYTDFPSDQLIQLDLEGREIRTTFINSVKEADFVRNGTARTVMSLSKEDSDNLWVAVQNHDLSLFNSINNKLLNPPGMELRHVPVKLYLPTSARPGTAETVPENAQTAGHMRVVQSLIPINNSKRKPQTLGDALKSTLPTIFPSSRNPIYARPILHGASVPLDARIEDLAKAAAYTDGFLHISVAMHG